MKRRAVIIVGVLAALVTAYLLGASRAPTREVRTVESVNVTRLKVIEKHRVSLDTAARETEGARVTRVITRTVPGPGCVGPTIERTEETIDTTRESSATTAAVAERASEENMSRVETVKVTELIEYSRPRWAVGAEGGLRFRDATAVVRGRFEVRALGPIWISAYADRESAGLGARVAW